MPKKVFNQGGAQQQPTQQPQQPQRQQPQGQAKKVFEAIPDGVYQGELVSVKYKVVDKSVAYWKDNDEEIVFETVITDGPFTRRRFWMDTDFDFGPGSELVQVLQELYRQAPLPANFEFDTDDLADYIGMPCRIDVGHYYSKAKDLIVNKCNGILAPLDGQYGDLHNTQNANEAPPLGDDDYF